MTTETARVFIGYDPREAIAYHVMSNSIIRHSTMPVALHPMALTNLESFYKDDQHLDGSNEFIYSRFLTPYLSNYEGWSLFVDGDMLMRDDIKKLWDQRDENKAVMVVQHDYKTRMETKYLGAKNVNYPRKNWSSVMLFNNSLCKTLTPEFVQHATGAELHRLQWAGGDDMIGELDARWNWLPDEYGPNENAALCHWTLGTPCFHEFAQAPMAAEWHREKIYTDFCIQQSLETPLVKLDYSDLETPHFVDQGYGKNKGPSKK